jgi:hypothetical protein
LSKPKNVKKVLDIAAILRGRALKESFKARPWKKDQNLYIPGQRCFLAIDDTFVFRGSAKAPESRIHHQHGTKMNRPLFVRGQNWVSLGLTLSRKQRPVAVPVLSRLSRSTGNSGKLVAAKTLLRVVRSVFRDRLVTVLLDSWYMRKTLIKPAQNMGYQVIGQVRKDTALYLPPPPHNGKRGRPRKYGSKLIPETVAVLPETTRQLFLYGKEQTVHYRSTEVLAYFLGGQRVRAVWSQLENKDGTRRQSRLLLCTDLSLTAEEILLAYNRRWSIEDMFNQMKNRWGWKDTWQQSRQVLHRWAQIIATAYALPQLLAMQDHKQLHELANLAPWRKNHPLTAGRLRLGLQRIFAQVDIRSLWNPKSGKFGPTKGTVRDKQPPEVEKAA